MLNSMDSNVLTEVFSLPDGVKEDDVLFVCRAVEIESENAPPEMFLVTKNPYAKNGVKVWFKWSDSGSWMECHSTYVMGWLVHALVIENDVVAVMKNEKLNELAKLKEECAELEESLAGQEEQIQKLAMQRGELKREVEYKDKRIASLLASIAKQNEPFISHSDIVNEVATSIIDKEFAMTLHKSDLINELERSALANKRLFEGNMILQSAKLKDNALIDELRREIKRLETADICNSIQCKEIFAVLHEQASLIKEKTGLRPNLINTLHQIITYRDRLKKEISAMGKHNAKLNEDIRLCRRAIADKTIEAGRLRKENARMRGQLHGTNDEKFIGILIDQCREHKKKWKSLKEIVDNHSRAIKI